MPEPPGYYAFSLGYQSLLYSFVVFFFWQNNQNHMNITKIFAYNGNLFLCKLPPKAAIHDPKADFLVRIIIYNTLRWTMPTVFWCFRLPLSILESRSAEISPISLTSSVTGARRLKFSGRRIFA